MDYREEDRLLTIAGKVTVLRPREGELLQFLMGHVGKLVTREQLEREVWGFRAGVRSEVVPVTVRRLRKKLGENRLETVRGKGWRLLPFEPESSPEVGLPHFTNRFVGRDAETAQIAEALERSQIVTLTGPGGVGKTRLAVEVASRHPAVFCNLAQARSTGRAAASLAEALGSPLGESDPTMAVGYILRARPPTLYVLDNLEQVAHDAGFIDAWAKAAPQARFLVTSRERLGSALERVVPVQPLALEHGRILFQDRACALAPEIDLAGDLVTTDAILELLDGLPLAIELAAARTPLLHPKLLLERLSDRFRLLVDKKSRSGRTLESCVQWSWDLLDPEEAAVLEQLSVFGGSFTLEDAEAVVAADPSTWLLDLLQSLVEKSLVQRRPDGRFALLVTIADFGDQRLTEPARAEVDLRHARWFSRHGELDSLIEVVSVGTPAVMQPLLAASTEIRRAASRIRELPPHIGSCVARAAWMVLRTAGPVGEGRAILEAALGRAEHPADVVSLAAAWFEAASVTGRCDGLDTLLQRTRPLTLQVDGLIAAVFHDQAGRALVGERRVDEGRALLQKALALHEEFGESHNGVGAVLTALAYADWVEGLDEPASEKLDEAIRILEPRPPSRALANALCSRATLSARTGEVDQARQLVERTRSVIEPRAFARLEARILWVEATLPGADPSQIRLALQEGLPRMLRHGCSWVIMLATRSAWLDLAHGNLRDARQTLELGVELAEPQGGLQLVLALANLTYFLNELGQSDEASSVASRTSALVPEMEAPEYAFVHTVVGTARLQALQLASARTALDKSAALGGREDPRINPFLCEAETRLALAEGDVVGAAEAVARFSDPEAVVARVCHTMVAAERQDWDAVKAMLAGIEPNPHDLPAWGCRARRVEALRRALPTPDAPTPRR